MVAASVYDLYKNRAVLSADNLEADRARLRGRLLRALIVVRGLIGFVSRHGFGPFAWYRIAIGLVMAGFLLLR